MGDVVDFGGLTKHDMLHDDVLNLAKECDPDQPLMVIGFGENGVKFLTTTCKIACIITALEEVKARIMNELSRNQGWESNLQIFEDQTQSPADGSEPSGIVADLHTRDDDEPA